MRLQDVIGQKRAIGMLERAVATMRVPHAYLFDGPDGVGKRTTAVALGAALACPVIPGEGCGTCDTCQRIDAGNHPDVRIFAATGALIKIETAQEIVALASERPHEAPARVIILDQADLLNANAANCLLKTLEEPAPGNHLVLVSAAPDRLLGTIRSRTQRVRFTGIEASSIEEWLVNRTVARDQAQTVAALCDGSVARALSLLEQDDADSPWHTVKVFREAAAGRGMGVIMTAASSVAGKEERGGLRDALTLLARLYRDVMVTSAGAEMLMVLRERRAEIEELAHRASLHHGLAPVRKALGAVIEAERDLGGNMNATTAVEALLLRLRALEKKPTVGRAS